jgi:mRNA-degrading endonuclease RelE of RelBE toxin-antitoxin system
MKPILHTLRMPEEMAALIRGMHPELKKKIKAGLKAIMEAPDTGKILRDELAGLRSMRVSKLRIIYRVSKKEIEFGSEHIPRSLLRGKRASDERLFPKNRSFSTASCGELQIVAVSPRIRIYDETYRLLQKEKWKST